MMFPKRFREMRIGFEIRQTQKCFIIFELKFEPIIESSLRVRIPSLSLQKGRRVIEEPFVLTNEDKQAKSASHIGVKSNGDGPTELEIESGNGKVSSRCSRPYPRIIMRTQWAVVLLIFDHREYSQPKYFLNSSKYQFFPDQVVFSTLSFETTDRRQGPT